VVPEDASVVALCQPQLAEQNSPKVTSVAGPADELGRYAVELLMRRIAEATGDSGEGDALVLDGPAAQGEPHLLTPVLTARDSSGPAPAAVAARVPRGRSA
jgi:DNA-binding LacI/PurR family transcriptional regulator